MVLERTDTITQQAVIIVQASSVEEARQQIAYDLQIDPGAYDSDLEVMEDSVGEIIIKVENQHEERAHFPRALAG